MKELIQRLKNAIQQNTLDKNVIDGAIATLHDFGYSGYDLVKFPALENTEVFDTEVGKSPETLAEALLWKLGKWPTYLTFVKNYKTENLKVSPKGGIVFSAFAKHLQDNDFPIYDQHAIRSIWAICDLDTKQQELCKSLLLDTSGMWKQAGSGDDGSCYELFVVKVEEVCAKNELTHRELDMLLMPLGQAIKKETRAKRNTRESKTDLQRFMDMCSA